VGRHGRARHARAPARRPGGPPLVGPAEADVAVIGGGFTGLSAALHLAEVGKRVVLLEAAEPGWGASGRNGGQVNPGWKVLPSEIKRRYGAERGEAMAPSAASASLAWPTGPATWCSS
jgi:glycine/D-amino acid oxidase-like deaminating enzyme